MGKFPDLNFHKPKLFAFYIGGKIKDCNIEMHDGLCVIAKSADEMIQKVKNKCTTFSSFHLDS